MTDQRAIGIFDSGMGGLTVLRELRRQLPHESFIYLGDTARLPYGTKSADTVRHYAEQMAEILVKRDIKMLVVACNTASAAALEYLRELHPELPIIGVIEPGAAAAVKATKNKQVAVLATEGTVNSGAYPAAIKQRDVDIQVTMQSCGLFVGLAEEGCVDNDLAICATQHYLQPVVEHGCDCVLLGCTHFPVFAAVIRKYLGAAVQVVDSAAATAAAVSQTLTEIAATDSGSVIFLVTDLPERFARVGRLFLGEEINPTDVQLIEVGN